jgi:outer membrane protein OmpU
MNNFKKIGLSALAGSLVSFSAANAEMTVSGGASVGVTQSNENLASAYYQNDSVKFTYSGTTENGLTVTQYIELDGASIDDKNIKIATDGLGTIAYHAHGGDTVMSGFDDKTPNAYDEPWALAKVDSATGTGADEEVEIINGASGNGIWRYDSPTVNGVTLSAAYLQGTATATEGSAGWVSSYNDFGITVSPDAVEGLTVGYAFGTVEQAATIENDESTLWFTYAYGPVTFGYQSSEVDGQTTNEDDESKAYGITYAVSDDFSIGYGKHEMDHGNKTTDQEATGISASYTMGGVGISLAMNDVENIGGNTATTRDVEAYDLAITFSF